MYVWIITAKSESGDEYGPEVYSKKPSEQEKKDFIIETGEAIDNNGPGNYDSYVYLTIHKCKVH